MTLPQILLLGAGGHARACIDVIEQEGRFAVGGLLGLPEEIGKSILGYSVVGSDLGVGDLGAMYSYALVTVGQIKTAAIRIHLFASIRGIGLESPIVISPHAYVSRHAQVGAGTIVMHGAVVNAGASVGCNCILNSLSLIEHDVVVEDNCHVSTGARINSGVRVGAGSFIGSGSAVRQGLTIGDGCIIGMGQRVLTDCPPGSRVPAWVRA